ncbi:MAG: hypothetical protein QW666_02820 [Candidatus Woesearchaeota archaeon]
MMTNTETSKRSKLWYLAIILVFALGWVGGAVFNILNAAEPAAVDNVITEPVAPVADTASLADVKVEPVAPVEDIKVVEPKPAEAVAATKQCLPDADGFKRCEWGPEYAEFPYKIPERDSPKNWIKDWEIQMGARSVTLNVQGAILASFADTNSMDPVFDAGANAIEIVPKSPGDIQVGDIVSYQTQYGTIVHRITEIGNDEKGWYAIFQGDNNPIPDPEKVRWEQIKRVVVAIIY